MVLVPWGPLEARIEDGAVFRRLMHGKKNATLGQAEKKTAHRTLVLHHQILDPHTYRMVRNLFAFCVRPIGSCLKIR